MATDYRDRIVDVVRVPASTLLCDERNWRQHPQSQKAALRQVLDAVGVADALLAYRDGAGRLVLFDGHLRRAELGDREVAVVVTDLTEEEAGVALATHDPITEMAEGGGKALAALLQGVRDQYPAARSTAELIADRFEVRLPRLAAATPERGGDAPGDGPAPDPDLTRVPAAAGYRQLVLIYDVTTYEETVTTLARLADARGLATNADAVRWLATEGPHAAGAREGAGHGMA